MYCPICSQRSCNHTRRPMFDKPSRHPAAPAEQPLHAMAPPRGTLLQRAMPRRRPPMMMPLTLSQRIQAAAANAVKGAVFGLAGVLLVKTPKATFKHRRRLWPALTAVGIAIVASLLSLAGSQGTETAVALSVIVGAGLFLVMRKADGWTWKPRAAGDAWKWKSLWWPATSYTTGAACLIGGTTAGVWGTPLPVALAGWAIATGVPWWWHHRVRPVEPIQDEIATWDTDVACQGGALPASRLEDYEIREGVGWGATVKLPPGKLTAATAATTETRRRIASAYRTSFTNVVVEPIVGGGEDEVRMTILDRQNPLQKPLVFDHPSLDHATGWATIGMHPDGTAAKWRMFTPGSGASMGMIFGAPGSGKSGLLNILLTETRHSGVAVTWLGDGEDGESAPDWQDNVDWFAGTIPEIRRMLQAAERIYLGRKVRAKTHTWIDAKQRERRGSGKFDGTPARPFLLIYIDEAPDCLADPECRRIIKQIGRKGRKFGIGIILITQVPALTEMGGDGTLRSVIASFNTVAFRTGDRQSKTMGAGKLPVDPYDLPDQWPDGTPTHGLGYVVGGGRMSYMRAAYVEDPYDWSTTGTPAQLEDSAVEDGGAHYESWRQRREDGLDGDDIGEEEETPKAGSIAAVQAAAQLAGVGGIGDRALLFLKSHGEATTGVIAAAVGAPLNATSQALGRLEGRDKVVGPKSGNRAATWRLARNVDVEQDGHEAGEWDDEDLEDSA